MAAVDGYFCDPFGIDPSQSVPQDQLLGTLERIFKGRLPDMTQVMGWLEESGMVKFKDGMAHKTGSITFVKKENSC